ncbi:hypothetical protein AJ79_09937 [Helicocarpus griseus UAMH5409]|uniref:Haloacid dehalogenase, type II n=1 Tax=Helicocarpus griseus UAMH5409 TaxID=1447875 RepID=A0A2B7WG49_9EURO|nr:hypothetical protein AJ79_09937 [Helicocarpus griseus UAMH5409]
MPPRTLLLTLDAFNTLFHPRLPVPTQYAQVAQVLRFPPHINNTSINSISTNDLASKISRAFRAAYKHESATKPNFGRNVAGFGGPREWWGNVIRGCFVRVVHEDGKDAGADEVEVPDELVEGLIKRFESREGYALYPDVQEFFGRMRRWREGERKALKKPFERVIVGVVSNSDDRIANILSSLGVRIGALRGTTGTPATDETRSGAAVRADIDFIVTSYEAGEEKPHRIIFDFAKERARECLDKDDRLSMKDDDWFYLHVGDHYGKDYEGAIGAGWDSFLLPREGEGPAVSKNSHRNSATVKQIQTLPEIFSRLGLKT